MATPQEMYARPFNKNSVQNRPIGTGATYSGLQDTSAKAMAMQSDIVKMQGKGNVNHIWPRGNHAVINAAGNTLRTISYYSVNSSGTPNNFPISLRMPPGPWDSLSEIGDSGLTVHDATGADPMRLYEIYRLNRNVMWAADTVRLVNVQGQGHAAPGTAVPSRPGMTASGVSYFMGVLRKAEIDARAPWQHAIHFALPYQAPHPTGPILSRENIWPSSAQDWDSNKVNNNTGAIPYGALLAIPPQSKGGPNIDALDLTQLGRILFTCMRDYGGYVVDGARDPVLRTDAQLAEGDWSALRTAFRAMWQYTRVVTNSVIGATAIRIIDGGYTGQIGTPTYPAGGGDPIAPNMAFDADGNGGTTPPPEPTATQMATSMGAVVRRIVPA